MTVPVSPANLSLPCCIPHSTACADRCLAWPTCQHSCCPAPCKQPTSSPPSLQLWAMPASPTTAQPMRCWRRRLMQGPAQDCRVQLVPGVPGQVPAWPHMIPACCSVCSGKVRCLLCPSGGSASCGTAVHGQHMHMDESDDMVPGGLQHGCINVKNSRPAGIPIR